MASLTLACFGAAEGLRVMGAFVRFDKPEAGRVGEGPFAG